MAQAAPDDWNALWRMVVRIDATSNSAECFFMGTREEAVASFKDYIGAQLRLATPLSEAFWTDGTTEQRLHLVNQTDDGITIQLSNDPNLTDPYPSLRLAEDNTVPVHSIYLQRVPYSTSTPTIHRYLATMKDDFEPHRPMHSSAFGIYKCTA
jgi:hypothetical protein